MDKSLYLERVKKYLKLLSLYINKEEATDFSVNENELAFFIKLSERHSLKAFFYQTLLKTHVSIKEEELKKLEEYYFFTLRKGASFDKERKELYEWLNQNEIPFLPLKGIIVKDYYLDPYSREFADNDILFNGKDDVVKKFFTNREYKVESYKKGNHDVYLKKPFYNFEMHRALFALNEDNKKNVVYFDKYLDKALVKERYEHYLKPEDFYIYFTAHSFKHYHGGGCGIRTILDYYFYLKKEQLDFSYIDPELKKLDLLEFSNNMRSLSSKLFNNESLTDEETEMLLYIASSGTYGTIEHSVAKGIEKKGKFGYLMSRIFPPMSFYKTAYPKLYKTKVLIPLAWFIRLFRIIFRNPKRAKAELKAIRKHKKEDK